MQKTYVKVKRKVLANPNHSPRNYKVVNGTKTPIPSGYARVTLTAGDSWGDGTGFQLLLDADATAYGVEIPTNGNLSDTSAASIANLPNIYSAFEYKIPTNADGNLETSNIVFNNSISIDIPAGVYDYCVTNPTPGFVMYTADLGDNYTFNEGMEYIFYITYSSNVNIETINPNAIISWNFNDGYMPDGFKTYNDDNIPNANIANLFPNGWDITSYDEINYFAASPSWFTSVAPADRWLVLPKLNLTTNNKIQFDIKSQDPSFLENISLKLSTTTNEKSAFTTTLWNNTSVPGKFTNMVIDLSNYNNQKIYLAFVLNSTDMFYGIVDNISILGQAVGLNDISKTSNLSIYPNPANDFFTISNANEAYIKVIDILGRTLITKHISSQNETISIKDLNAGIYSVQIIKDGEISSKKLIKK